MCQSAIPTPGKLFRQIVQGVHDSLSPSVGIPAPILLFVATFTMALRQSRMAARVSVGSPIRRLVVRGILQLCGPPALAATGQATCKSAEWR